MEHFIALTMRKFTMFMSSEFVRSLAFVSAFRSTVRFDDLTNVKLSVTQEEISIAAIEDHYMAKKTCRRQKQEEEFTVFLSPECVERILKEKTTGDLTFNADTGKIILTYGETVYSFSNPSVNFPDIDKIIEEVTNRPCKLDKKHGVCVLSKDFELLHKAIKAYNKQTPKGEKDSSYKMLFGDSNSAIHIQYRNFTVFIMP